MTENRFFVKINVGLGHKLYYRAYIVPATMNHWMENVYPTADNYNKRWLLAVF